MFAFRHFHHNTFAGEYTTEYMKPSFNRQSHLHHATADVLQRYYHLEHWSSVRVQKLSKSNVELQSKSSIYKTLVHLAMEI